MADTKVRLILDFKSKRQHAGHTLPRVRLARDRAARQRQPDVLAFVRVETGRGAVALPTMRQARGDAAGAVSGVSWVSPQLGLQPWRVRMAGISAITSSCGKL